MNHYNPNLKPKPNLASRIKLGLLGLCVLALLACKQDDQLYVKITDFEANPHNQRFFTQGLVFTENSRLLETTGLFGRSALYSYTLGETPQRHLKLDEQYFGEGLAQFKQSLFWLTWKAGKAFEINLDDYRIVKTHQYRGQGWGLTSNQEHLIRSDGSNILSFHLPTNFEMVKQITVTLKGKPVDKLNELEWINGFIYANVWYSDNIMKIDPITGQVVTVIDVSAIRASHNIDAEHVLNGIAYNPQTNKTLLTGKNWPVSVLITIP